MKKYSLLILLMLVCLPFLQGCNKAQENVISAESYFRIHIRANSNNQTDQDVKYLIKDEVVNFLTPYLSVCNNKSEVIAKVNSLKPDLKQICEKTLNQKGFSYGANIVIKEEYFPTRTYGDYVLSSDFYDALIVELGEASGDNWWCVVYPPLCFLNAKELNNSNIKYKSYFMELINKFFG